MYNHGAPLLVISLVALLTCTHGSGRDATPTTSHAQCLLNETLYTCSSERCCQSQSEVLVDQLKQIKTRFQGVDNIIRKDYQNIESIIKRELATTVHESLESLGTTYSLLHEPFNATLNKLYLLYLGNDKSADLKLVMESFAKDLLLKTFSHSNVTLGQYPRTIKGITIFWQMNTAQRDCVINYMIQSTTFGVVVRNITGDFQNMTQSIHEYMSLLGSMVRIIQKMVTAQETNNCINELVNMQQCSLCTEKPVCSAFYYQLLAQCVPQLEDLYSRWDSLMEAMSVLTMRLCEHSLVNMFDNVRDVAKFISGQYLDTIVYEHGVLAYMKCVQPDPHKRSILQTYGARQEDMDTSEFAPYIPPDLQPDQFVFHEGGSLMETLKVDRRSVTETPEKKTAAPYDKVAELSKCRTKLSLSFPPLDLGTTTWLNITISKINRDCWNGSSVGSYIFDATDSLKTPLPEALAIKELDEKMCRYTGKNYEKCLPKRGNPPLNNSHHGPSLLRVLASLAASLLYCCC